MSHPPLPILDPANVPWQASASYELIGVSATEETASATLLAYFGPHVAAAETAALEAAGEADDAKYNEAGYGKVVIEFGALGGLRLSPQLSEAGLLDPGRFDLSRLPGQREARQGGTWSAGGWCPDPRLYRVENSDWLPSLTGASSELRHWLLLGHSAMLEVAAERMTWRKVDRALP